MDDLLNIYETRVMAALTACHGQMVRLFQMMDYEPGRVGTELRELQDAAARQFFGAMDALKAQREIDAMATDPDYWVPVEPSPDEAPTPISIEEETRDE